MWRILGALVLAAVGLVLARANGAPWTAALTALAAGAGAWALRPQVAQEPPLYPSDPSEALAEPHLPPAADVLDAVDEPRLIVRARRVLLANKAARAMLGEHIQGQDVRIAIRHPAAAERLAERGPEPPEPRTRTELVGLGEPGRRWEMTTSRLGDGSRLVRLTDHSQAHAAEQTRVDFVANASHELRTPLATILGFIETLQDESAGSDAAIRGRFLKIMFVEASRMRQLVEDLLSLSRIEADRFTAPRDPVDLLPLLEEVRASLYHLSEQRGSDILVESRTDSAVVTGDRPQLAQLLSNLLSNSLKYGHAGAPVRVRLEGEGDLLRISVADQGDGIPSDHLPRLTERFYRVDPGRSRSGGGTGLGLAIVKHIVGRHRGRLEIRSTVGLGTVVDVWLPRSLS